MGEVIAAIVVIALAVFLVALYWEHTEAHQLAREELDQYRADGLNTFWQGDPPRFGRVPRKTINRDFDKLRKAIRDHDPFAAEAAWEKCERWLGSLPLPREGKG